MRTKSHLLLCLLSIAALLGVSLSVNSCSEKELTNDSGFSLSYPGISDIGAAGITEIEIEPNYRGGQPSDFKITAVTFEGNPVEIAGLSIDPENGKVTLKNTTGLQIGDYYVSISCISASHSYEFKDIIRIKIMRSVPEDIHLESEINGEMQKVESLTVNLADLLDIATLLPSAQITAEGEHISIHNYFIHEVRLDGEKVNKPTELFKISSSGLFTIAHSDMFKPGKYDIDFKLTTQVADKDSEEGLYADKFSVIVESEPLELVYVPNSVKVETATTYSSAAPIMTGSEKGVEYSIWTEENETQVPELSIDKATGVLSYLTANTQPIGSHFNISVKVRNDYGEKVFKDVFKIEIVAEIKKIENFSYDDVNGIVEGSGFTQTVKSITGSDVVYKFKNLPETLKELELDAETGTITLAEGNHIPTGDYDITVNASNVKNNMDATFTLHIIANPNMFTKVTWGNNINVDAATEASQYRVMPDQTLTVEIDKVNSDLPEGIKTTFKVRNGYISNPDNAPIEQELPKHIQIDEKGTITYAYGTKTIEMFVIEITVGQEHKVTKAFPIFFNNVKEIAGHVIEYTPFVLKINPRTGGEGGAPKFYRSGVDVTAEMAAKFSIDLKRNITFFNLNGPAHHIDGDTKTSGTFMEKLWSQYNESSGVKPANGGSRNPVSWWFNKMDPKGPGDVSKALCYYNPETGGMKVNPQKFMLDEDNTYANGIFCGEAQFNFDGKEKDTNKSSNKTEGLAIWFDTQF